MIFRARGYHASSPRPSAMLFFRKRGTCHSWWDMPGLGSPTGISRAEDAPRYDEEDGIGIPRGDRGA